MNDKQAKALGLRAVACPGWRWLPGMLARWDRPPGAGGQQVLPTAARVADLPMGPLSLMFCLVDPASVYRGSWPDFRDDATRGCLLGRVRAVHDDDSIWPQRILPDRWQMICSRTVYATGTTEAEALVAALEAAPTSAKRESENA